MSKLDETCAKLEETAKAIGVKVDSALLRKVAKGIGPSLYKADASKVAFSDKAELARVKANFAVKKLGVADDAKLDAALAEIKTAFGTKAKSRALVYYMLVKKYKKESVYA